MIDLFEDYSPKGRQKIGAEAVILRGYCLEVASDLLEQIAFIVKEAPFRHMTTPTGFIMSTAQTNCGKLGWVSDRQGYRYTPIDLMTKKPWPKMPQQFLELARSAASEAGFSNFVPDACLINRYAPGAKLSLHQDKDEQDLNAPIVSVSLGISAAFQFGGLERTDSKIKVPLFHGDVVVWGGVDRMRYHGILPIKQGVHSTVGDSRINLTFRKAALN